MTDDNRERVERVGVCYGPKISAIFSNREARRLFKEYSNQFDEPVEIGLNDFHTGILTPIVPEAIVLNHDMSVMDIGHRIGFAYLFDLIGEGEINPEGLCDLKLNADGIRKILRFQQTEHASDGHSNIFLNRGDTVVDALGAYQKMITAFEEKQALVYPGRRPLDSLYLKTDEFNRVDFGGGYIAGRFYVDTKILQRYRNIFIDPGGLVVPEEYLRTYIVPGGIPIQAIRNYEFWFYSHSEDRVIIL